MIGQGEKILEPFRRGLGYAAQWLDTLHVMVERKVEEALALSDQIRVLQHAGNLETSPQASNLEASPQASKSETSPVEKEDGDLVECSCFLRQLCPACFGGSKFGRPLEEYVLLLFIEGIYVLTI